MDEIDISTMKGKRELGVNMSLGLRRLSWWSWTLQDHLVVKCSTQKDDIDYKETLSPSNKDSFSIIMTLVALDVRVVLFNGNLDEDVYIDQSIGFLVKGKDHIICELK